MIFDTQTIFKNYPWLLEKKLPMIISCNYDGLICASFLSHHLNWDLVGYYNHESLWISKQAIERREEIIWVDLNILPKQGRAVGGHIVSVDGFIPKGFETSCNPNILNHLTANSFTKKFPFSTLIFLMWLYKSSFENNKLARLLILNSDATWLKWQHYQDNCKEWIQKIPNFNWDLLFSNVNSKIFDKQIDQLLYPELFSMSPFKSTGNLSSEFLNIKNKDLLINPDWDEDIIQKIFQMFSNYLKWTSPKMPHIHKRIDGVKFKCPLIEVKKIGLNKFINQNNIFSYAITSPKTFSYTTFGNNKKRVINA